MAFSGLLVTEIFHSLQGESSLIGLPFAFVRLTGCNLRCNYCDSTYSFKGGTKMSVEEILDVIRPYQVQHVLMTGGEPLLQRNTLALIKAFSAEGYQVSIETHGEVSIEAVSPFARIIMDFKTPGSGMCRGGFEKNIPFLKPTDEIKFVITSPEDYEWAKNWVQKWQKNQNFPTKEILFSPALPALNTPGTIVGMDAKVLAENILRDHLPVRFQLQLHKQIWGQNTQGV